MKQGGHSRGFTLLEVLIAMMIVSGGVIVISNAWSGNFMRVRKAAVNQEVVTLLERKLIEIEAKYKDQVRSIPEEEEGDFGSDYPRYTWKLESRRFELPDMSAALASESKGPMDGTMMSTMAQIQEFTRQVIREVRVTVYMKSRGKVTPFSVITTFVDFTQPVSLPGIQGLLGAAGAMGGGGQGGAGAGGSATPPPGGGR